ncbi:MAG: hypothetical protein N2441_04105 [Rhodocyclaceae bacterium]|nr:hypothetical protein [Rhodocyclaceae bacterium]
MASLTWFLDRLSTSSLAREQAQQTERALAKAKEALIAWSLLNALPGRLPCPEDTSKIGTPFEGQALASCSNSQVLIGRLSWKTLGVGKLLDGLGEPLWYVLSPGFRDSPLNPNKPASLRLDGASDELVALVISPGPPLPSQTRHPPSAAKPPLRENYLDAANADGDPFFHTRSLDANTPLNDRILALKKNELFAALFARVATEIWGDSSNGLVRYRLEKGRLPMAADAPPPAAAQGSHTVGYVPYNDPGMLYPASGWLHQNGWFSFITYRRLDDDRAVLSYGDLSRTFSYSAANPP